MRVPDAVIDIAIERYRKGGSILQAASGICAPMTLWRRMKERGVPARRRGGKGKPGPVDPERSLAIYRRYKAGERARDIAKSIGFKQKSSVLWHVWQAERVLLERANSSMMNVELQKNPKENQWPRWRTSTENAAASARANEQRGSLCGNASAMCMET